MCIRKQHNVTVVKTLGHGSVRSQVLNAAQLPDAINLQAGIVDVSVQLHCCCERKNRPAFDLPLRTNVRLSQG